jgi:ubiquinone biosynthesis protein UbiJ
MASLFLIPLLKTVETAFNSYLSLDVDAPDSLQPLLGKVVQIDVIGLGINVFFIFNEQRVEVCDQFGDHADVVIRGAPFSLLSVAGGRTGLMQSGVKIEGEVETANRFSRMLGHLDIDWEEHISAVAGDKPAHILGRLKRGATDWAQQSKADLERNVANYLRDETRHLPHQWEMDEFVDEVDSLRDRVDRLAQKVQSMDDKQS